MNSTEQLLHLHYAGNYLASHDIHVPMFSSLNSYVFYYLVLQNNNAFRSIKQPSLYLVIPRSKSTEVTTHYHPAPDQGQLTNLFHPGRDSEIEAAFSRNYSSKRKMMMMVAVPPETFQAVHVQKLVPPCGTHSKSK